MSRSPPTGSDFQVVASSKQNRVIAGLHLLAAHPALEDRKVLPTSIVTGRLLTRSRLPVPF
jgi:hypothetical protein